MELWRSSPNAVIAVGYVFLSYVAWTCFKTIQTAYDRDLRKVPGPFLSAFTNIPLKIAILSGRRSVYIHALHEQYGPYVRIAPREVAIADIQAFRTIHRVGSTFNKGPWYQGQAPGQDSDEKAGVFGALDNKNASHRRRLFQAAGTKKIVAEWEPQVIDLVSLTVQRIKKELEQDGQCDVMKWWTLLASDVVGTLAFGEPFGNVENGTRNQLIRDIEAAMPVVGLRAELPWTKLFLDRWPVWLGNTWKPKLERFFGEYGQNAVRATRAAHAGGNKTLFSKMVLDGEKAEGMREDQIVREAVNVIIAGTDTTAMTLTYLTYLVLTHEHARQKLVAELKSLSARPSVKELEGLTTLNNIIQEGMRLHPSIPGSLMRIVPPDGAQFGNYLLSGGTQVATQAWTFQRDPNIFEEPLRFNPDRWNKATPTMREHMMVFGGPARLCLGQNIAELEIVHAMARLFRECPDVALAKETTEDSMEMVDYFSIKPKAQKCIIIPSRNSDR